MRALLQPVTDELLAEIVRRIACAADPVQVVLFGSHARGDARPGSDIDLLVVEREPFGAGRNRLDEYARVRGALRGILVALDMVLVSADEVERWKDSRCHVIAAALREGQVLHAGPA